MKKFLVVLFSFLMASSGFPLKSQSAMEEHYRIEDHYKVYHSTTDKVDISLIYIPQTREIKVRYSCDSEHFELSEAIWTINIVIKEFAKTKGFIKPPQYQTKGRIRYRGDITIFERKAYFYEVF